MSRRRGHGTHRTDGTDRTYGGLAGGAGLPGLAALPSGPEGLAPAALLRGPGSHGAPAGGGGQGPTDWGLLFANARPSRDPALPMARWDSDWNAAQAPTGLTPEVLAGQLDNFYAGYFADIARTWEVLERRDGSCAVGRSKRLHKIARAAREWEVVAFDDSAEAEAQAEFLRGFYRRLRAESAIDASDSGGLMKAVEMVCDALGKQYAILARHWVQDGAGGLRLTLRHVPLWFFQRRQGRLEVCLTGAIGGQELDPEQWLVANAGRGVMEPACITALWKRLPVRQLVNILERWGRPSIYGKTTDEKGSAGWDNLLEALQAMISGWVGVLGGNATIEQIQAKLEANTLHMPWIEYCNRELTTLWLHSHLGTTAQTGTGTLAGGAQGQDTDELIAADCVWLTDVLRTQVDAPALRYALDVDEPLAGVKIELAEPADDQADLDAVERAVKLGVRVSVSFFRERFGLPEPKEDEETLTAPAAPEPFGGEMPPAAGDGSAGRGNASPRTPRSNQAAAETAAAGRAGGAAASPRPGAADAGTHRGLSNAGAPPASDLRPPTSVSVPDLAVPASWSAPVAAVLEEMQRRAADPAIADGELLAWLKAETARLPELARAMDVDGLAASLEAGMQAAVEGTVRGSELPRPSETLHRA